MANGKIKLATSGGGSISLQVPSNLAASGTLKSSGTSGTLVTLGDAVVTPAMLQRKFTFLNYQNLSNTTYFQSLLSLPWPNVKRISFVLYKLKLQVAGYIASAITPEGNNSAHNRLAAGAQRINGSTSTQNDYPGYPFYLNVPNTTTGEISGILTLNRLTSPSSLVYRNIGVGWTFDFVGMSGPYTSTDYPIMSSGVYAFDKYTTWSGTPGRLANFAIFPDNGGGFSSGTVSCYYD